MISRNWVRLQTQPQRDPRAVIAERGMDKIGFIGVGAMGGAIAKRLIDKGFAVIAYDRNAEALMAMEAAGAEIAADVRTIADAAEIVFACLPNAEICRAVALGPDGVAGGGRVRIYVELSTIGGDAAIEIADALAARGVTLIDAPVVGGTVALINGTLGMLAAGPKDAFARAKPALEAFAGRLFYLGEKAGMAQAGKVMSNAVSYAAVLSTCEAIGVGMRAGIDLETAVAIINQGSGANFFSQQMLPATVLKGVFHGTGAIETGQKDVKLFLEEARRMGLETPMASAVSALQKRVVESDVPGRDTMTYVHFFTDLAGLPRLG